MKSNPKSRLASTLLALAFAFGTTGFCTAAEQESLAEENKIEIIFTDVTDTRTDVLEGEAKIMVSVKGATGAASIAQAALEFSGDLNYKSVTFLEGENNPPDSVLIYPNTALANSNKKVMPSIVSPGTPIELSDVTDLFVLTFEGEPGDTVTLSLKDLESTYCTVDRVDYSALEEAEITVEASDKAVEGQTASVKLSMDKVTDFAGPKASGYKGSEIYLKITGEKNEDYTIYTELNNANISKGGHRVGDSDSEYPTFIIENTVLADDTYTVEITGIGYVPCVIENVDFDEVLEITNADFIPGDVDNDGKVTDEDREACSEKIAEGEYNEACDFNRDEKVDRYDLAVFEETDAGDDEEEVIDPDKIKIIFTDITDTSTDILEGESKIKVSVKSGTEGIASIIQTSLAFSGDMKYKSVTFLEGENTPPECFLYYPNAALANSNKKLMPSIISTDSSIELSGTTDLFVITFEGEVGDEGKLEIASLDGTFCTVDGDDLTADEKTSISFSASEKSVKGKTASIQLSMDMVTDFAGPASSGYKSSGIELKIISEDTEGYTIYTVLNNANISKGGHRVGDGDSEVPTFIIDNIVLANDTYTVEISGIGYVTYVVHNVDFDDTLEITNENFIPGDANNDGEVTSADRAICNEAIADNEFNEACDFNKDGKVNRYDLEVFDKLGIEDSDEDEDDKTDETSTPEKITSVSTSSVKTSSFVIKWTAPSDGGSAITGYQLKYGTSKTNLSSTKTITNATSLTYTLSGLSSGKTYYFQIAAKNKNGVGEFSDIKSVTTAEGGGSGSGSGSGTGSGSIGGGGSSTPPVQQTTYYTVNFDVGAGTIASGSAAIKVEKGKKTTSTPTVTAPAGKEFVGWTRDNGVTTINPENVIVNSNITFTAVYKDKTGASSGTSPNETFTDLGGHLWAKDAIYTLRDKGVINGTSATTYSPANNIKRGDFILILVRMLGIDAEYTENFADVPADSYYADAIGKAKAVGIAKGSGENFMPEQTITRQDLITLAYRAFLSKGYIAEAQDTLSLDEFADKTDISDYAVSAMASMVKAGIIKGSNGNVNPKNNATRAEVAVMCARLLELIK